MVNLVQMVLSGAVSWGVGRVLDVTLTCDNCGQRWSDRVGNYQRNALGCKNYWREVVQFTNACDYTVRPDGTVGHVAGLFLGGWTYAKDPAESGFFTKTYEGWCFFGIALRARAMTGKQFVVTGQIVDFNSGDILSQNDMIQHADSEDARWYGRTRLPMRVSDVPESMRDYRVCAVDLKLRSRYNDLLFEERLLANLFKPAG